MCLYCGLSFQDPCDEEMRSKHLANSHKFRECNQAKKFFRADHFRQHLKHSHAATSIEWTFALEEAFRKDEPLLGGWSIAGSALQLATPEISESPVQEPRLDYGDSEHHAILDKNGIESKWAVIYEEEDDGSTPQAKADPSIVCPTCHRAFTRRTILVNHQRTHTGEKPFACAIPGCIHTFAQQSDKTRHEQAQHTEKTFRCGSSGSEGPSWGCGKTFRRKDGLLEHHRKTAKGKKCLMEHDSISRPNELGSENSLVPG
jgi:hypothetical protein